jgi:hypothetical protein
MSPPSSESKNKRWEKLACSIKQSRTNIFLENMEGAGKNKDIGKDEITSSGTGTMLLDKQR